MRSRVWLELPCPGKPIDQWYELKNVSNDQLCDKRTNQSKE